MLKPDADREGLADTILGEVTAGGMEVLAAVDRPEGLVTEAAEEFYREHKAHSFFPALVAYAGSGKVTLLIVKGPKNAWKRLRQVMGATNGKEPGTIRYNRTAWKAYPVGPEGKDAKTMENKIHGSDSFASAVREIFIAFTPEERAELFEPEALAYMQTINRIHRAQDNARTGRLHWDKVYILTSRKGRAADSLRYHMENEVADLYKHTQVQVLAIPALYRVDDRIIVETPQNRAYLKEKEAARQAKKLATGNFDTTLWVMQG
jgi:nucleoside-diphosphate kinase